MIRLAWTLCLGLLGMGCGATAASAPPTVTPEPVAEQPAVERDVAAPEPTVAEASEGPAADSVANQKSLPPDGVIGVIDRQGLIVIIDQGLGRLFQRLKVSPFLKQGRFVGFEVTSIDPRWEISTLRKGDVITALNGQIVERPEQAMAAFERLRQADELVVDLLREGTPATLRYRIE